MAFDNHRQLPSAQGYRSLQYEERLHEAQREKLEQDMGYERRDPEAR
jgi:hypothetical protein